MTLVPRKWQESAADVCAMIARAGADRALIYACPGAGKTFACLYTAKVLQARLKKTSTIIVITPSLAVRSQWIATAKLFGLNLVEVKDARDLHQGRLPFGVDGYILSYQLAINIKRSLRIFCDETKPIIILDEVHHTAATEKDRDGNAWGVAIEYACETASFKLCTTGTPFRQGNNPIAFVHYNDKGEATATYPYTYEQAIRDGVCRPIEFEFYNGEVTWSKGEKVVTADFDDKLTKKLTRERLEAALRTDGQFPFRMLSAAHTRLLELRGMEGEANRRAGGIVVAIDVEHANAIAGVLEEISGERPVIVHSKLDNAQELIEAFRDGQSMWIIGINMLSEGVDIKRLRVGVYASRIRAPLYFHQFCGRVSRVLDDRHERAYVFLPRDPDLYDVARAIEQEKYHALGEEPERRARAGDGRGPGRKPDLAVQESDAEAVERAFSGAVFPIAYLSQHRPLIDDFKRKNPGAHNHTEAELLKWMIDLGAVPPPSDPEAA